MPAAWHSGHILRMSSLGGTASPEPGARVERASRSGIGPQVGLGGFLERFRRSGGVPAAVGGEASSELTGIFAALDEIEREAAALRERSQAAAETRARETEEEAQRLLAEAREQAESERDDALRAGLRAADAEVASLVQEGAAAAAGIRRAGEERLAGLVAEVVARVLEAPR